jgi:hypothetical protein
VIDLTWWYSHDQADGAVTRTPADVDDLLNRLAALSGPDWPALAEVTRAQDDLHGPLLYVGLHMDRGALMYSGPDNPDSSYTTAGGLPDPEPLLYMYTTSDCEFPSNSEVSAALIRQAAHEFADTGRRPTCVEWQRREREPVDTGSEWPGQ